MRILHLTTEFPPVIGGGLGVAVGGLATASARAGLMVDVLLVRDRGHGGYGQPIPINEPEAAQARSGGPAALTLFQIGWHEMEQAAVALARRLQPDVIHVHPVELWPVARAIRGDLGTPLVYTAHSLNIAEYQVGHEEGCAPLWLTQQGLIHGADRVIALTRSEQALLAECCPSILGRVRIIGNGIDDCGAARTVACRAQENRPPMVFFAGRFVERKGIHDLLAAIPIVLALAPATRFVLAGGYDTGPRIEQAWLPTSLSAHRDHIRFTGWLAPIQVAEWYKAADILVVPSWYEPFGLVILEGMLYGLPIVAAAVGGPSEILESERTAVLFTPRNVEALAGALLRLITQPTLRARIGQAAAQEVRCKWLWTHKVEEMRMVYAELRR